MIGEAPKCIFHIELQAWHHSEVYLYVDYSQSLLGVLFLFISPGGIEEFLYFVILH